MSTTVVLSFVFTFVSGICVPRPKTLQSVYKEEAFRKTVSDRMKDRAVALKSPEFATTPLSYYLVEPEYSCDVDLRVGEVVGDGAKYVCNPHHISHQSTCLYYGFGVNGNIHFDQSIQNLLNCEMHLFDPTPSVVLGENPKILQSLGMNFHAWGISGANEKIVLENQNVDAYTFMKIKDMLGHTNKPIDIVKIDVEGSEWQAFKNLLSDCDPSLPYAHQFLVELHRATSTTILEFYDNLARCGYRTFHKDSNLYCFWCMEYSFVHSNFIKCK
jgi:hypothetical protein